MRDAWERDHGLDPTNAADRNDDFDTDGYTNLEDYLNEIGGFKAVQPIVWDNTLGNDRYAQIENWDIAFQPSRLDIAVIRSGTAIVDAVGQHAGTLIVASNNGDTGQLDILAGRLMVQDAILIGGTPAAQGTVNLSGGELMTPLLSKSAVSAFNLTGGVMHADVVDFDLTNNGGTIAPGSSIGTTLITGDLALADGVLEIEIGGNQFGQYDRVEVDGAVTLGGTLKVDFVELNTGAYVPQQGDSFAFLAAFGGGDGTFDAFDLPDLPTGLAWAFGPGDATYYLTIIAAPNLDGDFNHDGNIDAADYVVWRKVGNTQVGYDTWRTHFGEAAAINAGGSTYITVPEPASCFVPFWPILFAWTLRRVVVAVDTGDS
jgi:hypothetical protein